MMLSQLLDGVTVTKLFQMLYGQMVVSQEAMINAVQYDSRRVSRGDLFVAIRGNQVDGHRFIDMAMNKGVKAVVVENDSAVPDSLFMHTGTIKIVVPDSRIALAQIAANWYRHPSRSLTMVGVTGTNGKTTTTHLIQAMLERTGKKTGLIGTIDYRIGDEVYPATHTTPESLELNEVLARMVERKCGAAVMEVSSHALHQHRVEGFAYAVAVFTNLTQDHLDYHGTMDAYFDAKKILFAGLPASSWAVVNVDDAWGERMAASTKAHVLTYGLSSSADVTAENLLLSMTGTKFTIVYNNERIPITSALIGRFNVSNLLGAFGTGIALGLPKDAIRQSLCSAGTVRGRFEQIAAPEGWTAVIDYAHTPDALEKALHAVHDVLDATTRGRILTVFGCGGNRDRTKRPKMMRIATEQSDVTIITSDNPRHEDPDQIIDEAMKGAKPNARVLRITDRKEAIITALREAGSGDVILIAGKGHEDYQIIDDKKNHFSDREVVEEFLGRKA